MTQWIQYINTKLDGALRENFRITLMGLAGFEEAYLLFTSQFLLWSSTYKI